MPGSHYFIMMYRLNGNKFTKRYKRLRKLNTKQWKQKLESISDKYLRRKVASIIWFDISDHTEDSSYLKEQSDKYIFGIDEDKTKEEDIQAELYRIGYPAWFAYFRSLTPKTHAGWRKEKE